MTSLKVSYADCIVELVPGAQWTIDDNNYSSGLEKFEINKDKENLKN